MQIRWLGAMLAAGMGGGLLAQTLTVPPTFEVASFRISAKPSGRGGERIEVAPGSLIMGNVRFVTAVRWAYHVLEYQVTGPAWIQEERYDIVAKAGTPVEEYELRHMLRTLLAERAMLEIHRQTKEMQAYVVTVGKNGHKMQQSATEGPMSVKPNGLVLTIERADLEEVAAMATQPLRGPVVNATGLTGKWDLKLNAAPYLAEAANMKEMPEMIALAITAAREQLGLNVESKKTPVEMIVIDRAEKTPIEN
jgi:uncharacterized protein (TIGR03435 family)